MQTNNKQPQPTRKTIKRMRGGQRGNQNARKHGFYSATLSVEEISQFWPVLSEAEGNLTAVQGLDPEVALVRLKLQAFLRQDPGNPRVISDASRLLAKWFSSKYSLDRTDTSYLKEVIESILEQSLGKSVFRPDLSATTKPIPQNEPSLLYQLNPAAHHELVEGR